MDNSIFALHRYPYTDYHMPVYDLTAYSVPCPCPPPYPPVPPCPPPCPPIPVTPTCPIGISEEIEKLKQKDIALDERISSAIKTQHAHSYPKNDKGLQERWHIQTPEQFSQWVELMNNGSLDNRCYIDVAGDYWIPYGIIQNVVLHITSTVAGVTLWLGDASVDDVSFYNSHQNWAGQDNNSRLQVRIGQKTVDPETGAVSFQEKQSKLYFEGGDCCSFNKVDFYCTVGFWGTYGRMIECGFMKPSEVRTSARMIFAIGGNISLQKCRWMMAKGVTAVSTEQASLEVYGAQEYYFTGDDQADTDNFFELYRGDAKILSSISLIQTKLNRGIKATDTQIFITAARLAAWGACKNPNALSGCAVTNPS